MVAHEGAHHEPVPGEGAGLADPEARLAAFQRQYGEYGGVNASIEVSTTFTVLDADTLPQIFQGVKGPAGGCYLYGRSFNPTVRYLGRQLAALEGGQAAYCCASGMAAISACLLALCDSGDHVVASNTVYGGTFALMKDFLPRKAAIGTSFVPITDLAAVEAAITPRTRAIYSETLSNPTLAVADIPALAALARRRGLKLVVDATFTPLVISPLRHGADLVVHSLTKFISGASDIIGGAVVARDGEFINALMDLHTGPLMLLGPTMDPKVASELSLRIPHLALRVREHSARAQYYAERLQALGARVTYPGLPTHPQHALLRRLANPGYGCGGMLAVELPSLDRAKLWMERLQNKHQFGLMAVSLGYFDTLMSASAASTSSELSPQELAAAGISGGLVRLSVGLTGSKEQRWAQLEEAWRHVAAVPPGRAPTFKAVQVTRDAITGELKRTPSWHSFGGEGEGSGSPAGASNGGASEDDGSAATSNTALLAAGGVEPGPGVKMRRLEGGAEVIYRPLAPAGAPSTAAAEGGQPLAASRHGSASHLEGLGGGEGGAASGATQ